MKKLLILIFLIIFQNNTSYSKDAWIGIKIDSNTIKLKEHYSLSTDKGLLISIVYQKSPADLAGLKAGDVVISVDKKQNIDRETFFKIASTKNPEDIIELEILRGNEKKIIIIKLGNIKNFNENAAITPESDKFATYLYWPGWVIKTPEQKISKVFYFSNPEIVKRYNTKNWIITCLDKRSDLFKKGVKLYDEILTINDQSTDLYEYSNKPFSMTVRRDSKVIAFKNIVPLLRVDAELELSCVTEFADNVCVKILFSNYYKENEKIDKELRKKHDLDIFKCCEKNNVSYLPFLEKDEGNSLRLDFFRFFLADLIYDRNDILELSKYIKVAETELKKIEIIKKKFPDYKLPDSYYKVADLLTKTNLYNQGFNNDVKIEYNEKDNIQRLKNRIAETVNNEIKNIDTLKLIEKNSYFLLQAKEEIFLEDIFIRAIKANYSENSDEYITFIGKFYIDLSKIYSSQKNIKKFLKNYLDAENWLNTKTKSLNTRLIYKKLQTGKWYNYLLLSPQQFMSEFKDNDLPKFESYLNEFSLLSKQEQNKILELDPRYLFDGYHALGSINSWTKFSDIKYDYHYKALEQIELVPKIGIHNKFYILASFLVTAKTNNDEITLSKILLDVKKFLVDTKGSDKHLVAFRDVMGNLVNFYLSMGLYAELEEILISYEKLFDIKLSESSNDREIVRNFFYYYGKSAIERNKNNYAKSVFYLEKITNNSDHRLNIRNILFELRNKNNVDLLQQVVVNTVLPDLFDGYYRIGNLKKIKEITSDGLGVDIDNVSYENLKDTLATFQPIRILNPLLSYYLQTNNIQKANIVANFIKDNLDRITQQNEGIESQKIPSDFTYNARELIKINQDNIALSLYSKSNDLVLQKYNNIFYNSLWKTSSNDLNSAVDFLEGSQLINSSDFFNKAFNTAQVIKNSNFSREILKGYLAKKNNENILLFEYHNLQTELISLIKMEELKLTRSADKITQATFKKDFDEKKDQFSLIEDKVRLANPEYFKSIRIEGVKLRDIQSKLKPNQAVLDYYFSKNKLAVVIIKKNSYNIHIEEILIDNLLDIKNNIRNSLQISKNGRLIPFDLKNGFKLNEVVFLNLRKYLENINYLFVVPHGPLNEIPIHTLPKNNGNNCIDCSLVEWNFLDYTFNYLASLDSFQSSDNDDFLSKVLKENFKQVYNELENNKNLKKVRDEGIIIFSKIFESTENDKTKEPLQISSKIKYLGIGDPDLYQKISQKAKSLDNTNSQKLAALRSVNLNNDNRSINIQDFYSPLKGSREEVIFAAKIFGEDNSKVWLKENATETNIKQTDLRNYNIIHFATHAEVSGAMKGLNEPFLVLSPPKEKSLKDNGLLMMNEIMQLNLNADLVILSACNTGSVEDEYSGSYSGLAKAFFIAGTKSVLVSNWYVEDAATQRLIQKFIENMIKDKGNFAENLNITMKELSKQKSQYSHPIFWAPFVFVGTDLEVNNKLN